MVDTAPELKVDNPDEELKESDGISKKELDKIEEAIENIKEHSLSMETERLEALKEDVKNYEEVSATQRFYVDFH